MSITVRITILSPFYLSVAAGDVPRIEVSRLCVVLAHRGAINANGAPDRTLIHAVHLCIWDLGGEVHEPVSVA